ncbi:MAG TPA: sigma-70 family RNA polymerase sigma factor [Bryobacteraceae bacterium]|nr:sigma-70 family RNA polymerase sigma factor [Bryobacteraceae bacterium]
MEWAEQAEIERVEIEKARGGDSEAFRLLVERHSRALFRLGFRMTGNESDAEDVVQETFLKAYRQLGSFDGRAGFGTWLYRIAANCALDLVRARQRRGEQRFEGPAGAGVEAKAPLEAIASAEPAPDRLAMSGEVRERLAQAMNGLSAAERAAFVLRHFEGMCIEDVGRALGCQTGAAKHSVFRAVQKLRRALEPLVTIK